MICNDAQNRYIIIIDVFERIISDVRSFTLQGRA
jgi:hypothetical protein